MCLSELGADVFFQPMLKNGEMVGKPKVRKIAHLSAANFRGIINLFTSYRKSLLTSLS
jgi:hypothetical protein